MWGGGFMGRFLRGMLVMTNEARRDGRDALRLRLGLEGKLMRGLSDCLSAMETWRGEHEESLPSG